MPTPTRDRQPKADCPFCGHWASRVTGGRYDYATQAYVRPRKCLKCGKGFETEETLRRTAKLERRVKAFQRYGLR